MKMTKRYYLVLIQFCLIFLFSSCEKAILATPNENTVYSAWEHSIPIPYAGYICGFENAQVYINLPILVQKNSSKDMISELHSISLMGETGEILCSAMSLDENETLSPKYDLFTLSMYINFPKEEGNYKVNSLHIKLRNGKSVQTPLNLIELIVKNSTNIKIDEDIEMTEMNLNQFDYSLFSISLANKSSYEAKILGFSYSKKMFAGIGDIIQYKGYMDKDTVVDDNLLLPEHYEGTFDISMIPNSDYFKEEADIYFFYLPFLYYNLNGEDRIMPAQTQPTRVEGSMTIEALEFFYENTPVKIS